MSPAELFREGLDCNRADRNWKKAFSQLRDLGQLPLAPLRCNRMGTDQEQHGIGIADEVGKLTLPLLAVGEVAAVDNDFEALPLQRGCQFVGCGQVAPGVGDEYAKSLDEIAGDLAAFAFLQVEGGNNPLEAAVVGADFQGEGEIADLETLAYAPVRLGDALAVDDDPILALQVPHARAVGAHFNPGVPSRHCGMIEHNIGFAVTPYGKRLAGGDGDRVRFVRLERRLEPPGYALGIRRSLLAAHGAPDRVELASRAVRFRRMLTE